MFIATEVLCLEKFKIIAEVGAATKAISKYQFVFCDR